MGSTRSGDGCTAGTTALPSKKAGKIREVSWLVYSSKRFVWSFRFIFHFFMISLNTPRDTAKKRALAGLIFAQYGQYQPIAAGHFSSAEAFVWVLCKHLHVLLISFAKRRFLEFYVDRPVLVLCGIRRLPDISLVFFRGHRQRHAFFMKNHDATWKDPIGVLQSQSSLFDLVLVFAIQSQLKLFWHEIVVDTEGTCRKRKHTVYLGAGRFIWCWWCYRWTWPRVNKFFNDE